MSRMSVQTAQGLISSLSAAVQEALALGATDFDLTASLQAQGQQAIDDLVTAIAVVKAKSGTP